jgi:hypothetical protein
MLPRTLVALALIVAPALAHAQSQGAPSFSKLKLTGSGSAIDPMNLLPARSDLQGTRGPLMIWNNPNGSTAAGYNAGFQVWIGDNPTATPGAGDTVAGTIGSFNGNGRSQLWGLDIVTGVCPSAICGTGYNDAQTRGIEVEAGNGYTATELNPWGGGFRKNGIEFTGRSGGAGLLTAASVVWANDSTGALWWDTGHALSRVRSQGFWCQANPNGTSAGTGPFNVDGVNAFQVGCLYDSSNSAAVLKVGPGTHNSVLDLSTATSPGYLIKGSSSASTLLTIGNAANYNLALALDSGSSSSFGSDIYFNDRGSVKWLAGKDAAQNWRVFNPATSRVPLQISPNDQVSVAGPIKLSTSTVAALPTCNAAMQDSITVVTDATSPTYRGTLTGGGTVRTPVYCDGSSWTSR